MGIQGAIFMSQDDAFVTMLFAVGLVVLGFVLVIIHLRKLSAIHRELQTHTAILMKLGSINSTEELDKELFRLNIPLS